MKGKLPMLSLIKQEGVVFDAWKCLTLAENQLAETVDLPVSGLHAVGQAGQAAAGRPLRLAVSGLPRLAIARTA
jgi:hypothetical protein